MRLELRYGCLLVVFFISASVGGAPRCALASERSVARDSTLILRLAPETESPQRDVNVPKESAPYMAESSPQSKPASTNELRLPSLQSPLPVDPWFPGRGAIGVKLEVKW